MIQLRAFNQSGRDQFLLDLKENEDISLSYEFSNVQDISKINSSFSKTFRLPPSEANFLFFGAVYDANVSTGYFDPRRKAACYIFNDSIPVFEGSMRLTDVIIENGKDVEFEVQILGETASLYRTISGKLLEDLDLTDYDHNLDLTNVIDGLEGTTGIFEDDIKYNFQDFGENLQGVGESLPNDIYGTPRKIWQFKPYIRARTVFDKIMETAGITYESSDEFSYILDNYYMLCHKVGLSPQVSFDKEFYCIVGLTSDFSFSGGNIFQTIPFNDESTGDFHDDYSLFDTTSHEYNFPNTYIASNGITEFHRPYKFEVTLNITSATAYNNIQLKIGTQTYFFAIPIGTNDFTFYYESGSVTDTDSIYVQIRSLAGSASFTITNAQSTRINCWDGVGELDTLSISIADNMPKVEQISFIKDIINRSNSVIVPDGTTGNLYFATYNQYIDEGSNKDWTAKLDVSKAYRLTPTTSLQNKEINLTPKEGKDLINQTVKDSLGRVYSRKQLFNPDNEFATGKLDITIPSAATPMSYIHGTNILVGKFYSELGKPIEGDLRFFHINETQTISEYSIEDGSGSFDSTTSWIPMTNYDVLNPDLTDNDINFGSEDPLFLVTAKPVNTSYLNYWERYILELYSKESRLFTGYFALTPTDINTFRFNDKIFIKDSFYRVNRISGYNPKVEQSTKVELIKLNTDFTNVYCSLTPYNFLINGQVLFSNGTINTLTGSRACCNYYGYTWIGSDCRWNLGGSEPPRMSQGTETDGVTQVGDKAFSKSSNELTIGGGSNKQSAIQQYETEFNFSVVGIQDITELYIQEDSITNLRITYLVSSIILGVSELSSYTYDLLVWNKAGTLGFDSGYTATKLLQGYSTHEFRLNVTSGLKLQIIDTDTSGTTGRVTMRVDVTEQKIITT